jgi:DNA-binding response OmpR family regulator
LSKTQILEQIFDADGHFVDDNTVAVNIRRLRAKILDSDDNRMIRNVRGMGYVWDCEVMQKM